MQTNTHAQSDTSAQSNTHSPTHLHSQTRTVQHTCTVKHTCISNTYLLCNTTVFQHTCVAQHIFVVQHTCVVQEFCLLQVWSVGEYLSPSYNVHCTPDVTAKLYETLEILAYEISRARHSANDRDTPVFSARLCSVLMTAVAKVIHIVTESKYKLCK